MSTICEQKEWGPLPLASSTIHFRKLLYSEGWNKQTPRWDGNGTNEPCLTHGLYEHLSSEVAILPPSVRQRNATNARNASNSVEFYSSCSIGKLLVCCVPDFGIETDALKIENDVSRTVQVSNTGRFCPEFRQGNAQATQATRLYRLTYRRNRCCEQPRSPLEVAAHTWYSSNCGCAYMFRSCTHYSTIFLFLDDQRVWDECFDIGNWCTSQPGIALLYVGEFGKKANIWRIFKVTWRNAALF